MPDLGYEAMKIWGSVEEEGEGSAAQACNVLGSVMGSMGWVDVDVDFGMVSLLIYYFQHERQKLKMYPSSKASLANLKKFIKENTLSPTSGTKDFLLHRIELFRKCNELSLKVLVGDDMVSPCSLKTGALKRACAQHSLNIVDDSYDELLQTLINFLETSSSSSSIPNPSSSNPDPSSSSSSSANPSITRKCTKRSSNEILRASNTRHTNIVTNSFRFARCSFARSCQKNPRAPNKLNSFPNFSAEPSRSLPHPLLAFLLPPTGLPEGLLGNPPRPNLQRFPRGD